jgi:hypothetical protein
MPLTRQPKLPGTISEDRLEALELRAGLCLHGPHEPLPRVELHERR